MLQSYQGEIAALLTAGFWTITAISFELAGKKIGSFSLNWIRLVLGFLFLSIFTWITRGQFFPTDATSTTWMWLAFSGIIGFTFGDLCLFEAFILIGSRISMLIMCLVPPFTALLSWIVLGETLSIIDILGMTLTVAGISWVIIKRPGESDNKIVKRATWGVLLAIGGALGQASGLILSKYGMGDYNAFAATQIRIIAGFIGFSILFFPFKKWSNVGQAYKHKKGMMFTTIGAFFGPFLGVSFSLLAIQKTLAGVASTIMAIVPILIIPPSVIIFKEKVAPAEIIGAIVAVIGVAILFL